MKKKIIVISAIATIVLLCLATVIVLTSLSINNETESISENDGTSNDFETIDDLINKEKKKFYSYLDEEVNVGDVTITANVKSVNYSSCVFNVHLKRNTNGITKYGVLSANLDNGNNVIYVFEDPIFIKYSNVDKVFEFQMSDSFEDYYFNNNEHIVFHLIGEYLHACFHITENSIFQH